VGIQFFRYQLDDCPSCGETSLLVTYRGSGPPGAQSATDWQAESGECRQGCGVDASRLPAMPKPRVGRFLLHWRAEE
jgi:hypothetical protein